MSNLLKEVLNFIIELGVSVWEFLVLSLVFVYDIFMILHTEMPRLEGLLAGVLLAWFMARRDKHPIMKAASAPLKLVLDLLDAAWDKGLVRVKELLNKGAVLAGKPFVFLWKKVKDLNEYFSKKMKDLKDRLLK